MRLFLAEWSHQVKAYRGWSKSDFNARERDRFVDLHVHVPIAEQRKVTLFQWRISSCTLLDNSETKQGSRPTGKFIFDLSIWLSRNDDSVLTGSHQRWLQKNTYYSNNAITALGVWIIIDCFVNSNIRRFKDVFQRQSHQTEWEESWTNWGWDDQILPGEYPKLRPARGNSLPRSPPHQTTSGSEDFSHEARWRHSFWISEIRWVQHNSIKTIWGKIQYNTEKKKWNTHIQILDLKKTAF